MMSTLPPDLMSADELAKRLGIGRALVYAGTKSGQLPAQLIGHRFYCRREWVDRFEQTGQLPDQPRRSNPSPVEHPFVVHVE